MYASIARILLHDKSCPKATALAVNAGINLIQRGYADWGPYGSGNYKTHFKWKTGSTTKHWSPKWKKERIDKVMNVQIIKKIFIPLC